MKKKVFLGTLAAMIFSIYISAFAAPTAAFGDVSAGNHIAAPYAKSDIIVPRPSASKYVALQKYAYIGIPADVKGHWAEKYLTYFLQAGCMDGSAVAFHPNEPITYADFAAVVARLGLKPVEFNGGTVSHKVFRDAALWNTAYPDAQAALICGEARCMGKSLRGESYHAWVSGLLPAGSGTTTIYRIFSGFHAADAGERKGVRTAICG